MSRDRPEWDEWMKAEPLPEVTGWVVCDRTEPFHRGKHGELDDCLNPTIWATATAEAACRRLERDAD